MKLYFLQINKARFSLWIWDVKSQFSGHRLKPIISLEHFFSIFKTINFVRKVFIGPKNKSEKAPIIQEASFFSSLKKKKKDLISVNSLYSKFYQGGNETYPFLLNTRIQACMFGPSIHKHCKVVKVDRRTANKNVSVTDLRRSNITK